MASYKTCHLFGTRPRKTSTSQDELQWQEEMLCAIAP